MGAGWSTLKGILSLSLTDTGQGEQMSSSRTNATDQLTNPQKAFYGIGLERHGLIKISTQCDQNKIFQNGLTAENS